MPWSTLDLLRKNCDAEIRSFLDDRSALAWRVVVRPRPPRDAEPPIVVTRTKLPDAVQESVEEAQVRGWLERTPVR